MEWFYMSSKNRNYILIHTTSLKNDMYNLQMCVVILSEAQFEYTVIFKVHKYKVLLPGNIKAGLHE